MDIKWIIWCTVLFFVVTVFAWYLRHLWDFATLCQERQYFFLYLFVLESQVQSRGLYKEEREPWERESCMPFAKILPLFCRYHFVLFMASLMQRFVSAIRLFRDLKPRTFHKYLTIACICINWIWNVRSGMPVLKRARLSSSRICEWDFGLLRAWCSTSFPMNSSERSVKNLLAATKHHIRLATNISQVFDNYPFVFPQQYHDQVSFHFIL